MRSFAGIAVWGVKLSDHLASGAAPNTSLQGVIKLLNKINVNKQKTFDDEAKVYDGTACRCKKSQTDLVNEFEIVTKEKTEAANEAQILEGKLSKKRFTLMKFEQQFQEAQENVKAVQAGSMQVSDFSTSSNESRKTIDNNIEEANEEVNTAAVMDKARTDKENQNELASLKIINQPYLKEKIKRETLKAKDLRANAETRLQNMNTMIGAMDQVMEKLKPMLGQAKEGGTKKIMNMVHSLKTKIQSNISAVETGEGGEMALARDAEVESGDAKALLELSKKDAMEHNALAQELEQAVEKRTAEIQEYAKHMQGLQDTLRNEERTCRESAVAWKIQKEKLTKELTGLQKAMASLKTVPGAVAEEPAASFLQVPLTSETEEQRVERAISYLGSAAYEMEDQDLAAFTMTLRVGRRSDAGKKSFLQMDGIFAEVVAKIKQLIKMKEEEGDAQASKEEYCNEEKAGIMNDLDKAKEELDTVIAALTDNKKAITKHNRAEKESAEEIAKLHGDIDATKADQKEAINFYTSNLAMQNQTARGIQGAVTALQGVFDEGSEAVGNDVISMLKEQKDEAIFSATVATMNLQCSQGDEYTGYSIDGNTEGDVSCENGTTDRENNKVTSVCYENRLRIESLTTEVNDEEAAMAKTVSDLEEQIVEEKDNQQTRKDKQSTVRGLRAELKQIMRECEKKEDSYESRKARRAQELAALKQALFILEADARNSERGAAANA